MDLYQFSLKIFAAPTDRQSMVYPFREGGYGWCLLSSIVCVAFLILLCIYISKNIGKVKNKILFSLTLVLSIMLFFAMCMLAYGAYSEYTISNGTVDENTVCERRFLRIDCHQRSSQFESSLLD